MQLYYYQIIVQYNNDSCILKLVPEVETGYVRSYLNAEALESAGNFISCEQHHAANDKLSVSCFNMYF